MMFGSIYYRFLAVALVMSSERTNDADRVPWQQELLDSIWLLALAAVLFFTLSYVVWGIAGLLTLTAGGV